MFKLNVMQYEYYEFISQVHSHNCNNFDVYRFIFFQKIFINILLVEGKLQKTNAEIFLLFAMCTHVKLIGREKCRVKWYKSKRDDDSLQRTAQ